MFGNYRNWQGPSQDMKMPWRPMALSEQKRVSEDGGETILSVCIRYGGYTHVLFGSFWWNPAKKSVTKDLLQRTRRITEVDVHIISVRISFFQKSNQPRPVAFFRFTPCRSPDVHWHKSRRFVRLFTSDGIDDTAMFCLESWRLATKGIPESSNQMWTLCFLFTTKKKQTWDLNIEN